MNRKMVLINLIMMATVFAIAIGCGNQSQTIDYGKKEPAPMQDIDGDNKEDIVFVVKITAQVGLVDYVFYKRNLGEGQFSEPSFLYKSKIAVEGLPYECINMHSPQSEREKYLKGLIEKVEKSQQPQNAE